MSVPVAHRRLLHSSLVLLILMAGALAGWFSQAHAQATETTETWRGSIALPGMALEFFVVFTRNGDEALTAVIDIPMQGAVEIPLSSVVCDETTITFTLQPAGAVFSAKREGDTAKGDLKQAGQTFPIEMRRLSAEEAAARGLKRPQTPKPPFPYATEDVTFQNPRDQTTLAGTLSIPRGDGPFPAVVFITGSGPQDRDETIFGHKPFLVIADRLARRGIASLRYDDRGIGGSTGSVLRSTSHDTALDVRAAMELLRARPEIDADHIGLIGHSEGGIVAPMVAAEHPDTAFIVLLAGTGLPGKDVLADQLAAMLRWAGVPEESIQRQIAAQQAAIDLVIDGAEANKVRAMIEELVLLQSAAQRDEQGEMPGNLGALVDQQMVSFLSPWFQSFLALDPRAYLSRVTQPVLALNGSLDFQVSAALNLPEIRKALEAAGNTRFVIRELPRLNHLFQTAESGMLDEYARIEETFNEEALTLLTDWILETTGRAR